MAAKSDQYAMQDPTKQYDKPPMERPGQPVEVAPAYVFFASQESSYITAETLGVTGGQHLP